MLPTRSGRIADPLSISVVRELTQEDLLRLATAPITKVAAPPLQRLRAPHHAAARLLALGKKASEVAILVGYTPQRIRDLQLDPAFKELVAYYADMIEGMDLDDGVRLRGKLTNIAEEAVDEIAERLGDDDKRARVPIGELRQIAELGLDRTVAPPKTAVPGLAQPTHITFNVGGTIDRVLPPAIEHQRNVHETQEATPAQSDHRPAERESVDSPSVPAAPDAEGQ